jgi:hypothetical protein
MAFDGTQVSFDLRDNRTIFYTLHSRRVQSARDELSKQIQRAQENGYKPNNPIIEVAGIIKLEQSSDPNQNAIGQLMSMVESLRAEFRSTIRDAQLALQTSNSNLINAATTAIAANAAFSSSHARNPTLLGSFGVVGTAQPLAGGPRVATPDEITARSS